MAEEDETLASLILLPLIEFEFAFNGAQKPSITQSEQNKPQLNVLFEICKKHGWTTSNSIKPLGNKQEYWFKLNNTSFKKIYQKAGPMADPKKDKWAKLLCERSEGTEKNRNVKKEIIFLLKSSNNGLTTIDICLKTRRLPYTITRHLRGMERAEIITKNGKKWLLSQTSPKKPLV